MGSEEMVSFLGFAGLLIIIIIISSMSFFLFVYMLCAFLYSLLLSPLLLPFSFPFSNGDSPCQESNRSRPI
jgi:hypothetical protein